MTLQRFKPLASFIFAPDVEYGPDFAPMASSFRPLSAVARIHSTLHAGAPASQPVELDTATDVHTHRGVAHSQGSHGILGLRDSDYVQVGQPLTSPALL